MNHFIGVDVGGTTTTVAYGNQAHEVLAICEPFATDAALGPDTTLGHIVAEIEEGSRRLGADLSQIAAVALATPGPATKDGTLLTTPNLDPQLWDRCPIRRRLCEQLQRRGAQAPVLYIGDGQAAALGEYAVRKQGLRWPDAERADPQTTQRQSTSDELRALAFLAVGTGLGGGEVQDGAVVRGSQGRAGHAGHMFLPPQVFRYEHDQQLLVGNAYCTVESAVSLTALAHQLSYRLRLDAWRDHRLHQVPGTAKERASRLRELADQEDPLAMELFDDQAKAIGCALLQVNYWGDYDQLVIGGGVCDLSPRLRMRYLQRAEATYKRLALHGFQNLGGINFSICGDHASVLGALAHAYGTPE